MKKHFLLAAMMLVLLVAAAALTACNFDFGDVAENNSVDDSSESQIVTFYSTPVNAQAIAPPNDELQIIDSYTDGENNYYLLDAGQISDIYIATLAQIDYTGVPVTFSKTTTSSSTVTNSLAQTISESYSLSTSGGYKIGLSAEAQLPAVFSVKGSFEWSFSGGTDISNTKSTSSTTATAQAYGESQTISYSFGENTHSIGRYRYAIYGTVDMYYTIMTSANNDELLSWDITACALPNEYYLRSEYAADGIFNNTPQGDITFPEDFYKDLPLPTTVILPQTPEEKPENLYMEFYFDSGSLEGWEFTYETSGSELLTNDNNAFSGRGMIRLPGQNSSLEYKLNIADSAELAISFQASSRAVWAGDVIVEYSLNNGTTYTAMGSKINYSGGWTNAQYSVSEIEGNVLVRIRKMTGGVGHCFIDDIKMSIIY